MPADAGRARADGVASCCRLSPIKKLRRRQTVGGTSTTHLIHDIFGNIIAETNGTAAGTQREYIWLYETEIAPTYQSRAQVDRPVAVVDATTTMYMVHVDHLNRPIKMTNAAKASVWDAVWLPWGGAHSITGTAILNARLPGQWFQLEAGLHYNWHRSYDPTIGRYTQPDPLGFVDGPSVYGYAVGSPGQAVDPDGRAIVPAIRCLFNSGCRTTVVNYCKDLARRFIKDESGGKGKKRDIKQVDDAFKEAAKEAKVKPTDSQRGDFRDLVHDTKKDGQGDFSYKDLLDLARRFFGGG